MKDRIGITIDRDKGNRFSREGNVTIEKGDREICLTIGEVLSICRQVKRETTYRDYVTTCVEEDWNEPEKALANSGYMEELLDEFVRLREMEDSKWRDWDVLMRRAEDHVPAFYL